MGKATSRSRGFTLIASLLLLALLSAVAVGLIYMVNGSGRVGGSDLEANTAYYGAESGMEKLTSDLANLYQVKLAPTQADLDAMAAASPPSAAQINGMTYLESAKWSQTDAAGNPITRNTIIASGQNQGLTAEIVPITLQVSAIRPSGASVNMTRGVQVALVPVFQFGVFSDSDLSYFPGPLFRFAGRVHTNGNLFLAADSGPLYLGSKVTAVGEIIRDRLANNFRNGANYQGSVYVSNAAGGCDTAIAGGARGPNCLDFGADANNATNDASWSGGIPPAGTANLNWAGGTNISTGTFNGMIGNANSTGVQPLQLPFVSGAAACPTPCTSAQQIQIIRRPLAGENALTPLGASREYFKANIHILLADTQAGLRPGSPANDGEDVDLTNGCVPGVFSVSGAGNTGTAWADPAKDVNWKRPLPSGNPCDGANAVQWPLYSGWLRVEYKDNTGNWIGVTNEWLQLGWARGVLPPSVPVTTGGAGSNTVNPEAILILQQLADRDGSGTLNGADAPSTVSGNYSWYPINFFDPREGFYRDAVPGGWAGTTNCYTAGIMNTVELDVGNLRQWLLGNAPYNGLSGTKVDPSGENGYLVYFSDRRGLWADPNASVNSPANQINGESGLEDDINSAVASGAPNGTLEAITPGYNDNIGYSPEDVDENGVLDNWGWHNMAEGFGIATPNGNPYVTVDCYNRGRQNKVSGPRHVLRLVDGSLNNVPTKADGTGGFTVASENPVYILGNYNTNAADPFWGNVNAADIPHAAAAVIADTVTLLSNNWSDVVDMKNPITMTNRNATNTYYRMAIASGKNMNFPWQAGWRQDLGTDGGLHNFLRFIEDWSPASSNYRGSLISLYYSQYETGIFKCCTLVYNPPNRNFYFDTEFLIPTNLPPGTPVLQDINNLTYWQSFTPCSTQANGSCTN
jgi:Tfp pilus assembly protein PilX